MTLGIGDASEAGQAVGEDSRADSDHPLSQGLYTLALEARDASDLDPFGLAVVRSLDGRDNRRLAGAATPGLSAGPLAAQIRIIHLDTPSEVILVA